MSGCNFSVGPKSEMVEEKDNSDLGPFGIFNRMKCPLEYSITPEPSIVFPELLSDPLDLKYSCKNKKGIIFIIIISPITMAELITRPFHVPHSVSLSHCLNANLPDIVCRHVIFHNGFLIWRGIAAP